MENSSLTEADLARSLQQRTIEDLCAMTDDEILEHLRDLSDLPSSLIVTGIASPLFTNDSIKECFEKMFRVFDLNARFDYFRNFRRCKIQFCSPNAATLAKLTCHMMHFHGSDLKCFFGQISDEDLNKVEDKYLKIPPLEKQFLISPPASPPIDWEQTQEKQPNIVTQQFELFSRLAALAIGDSSPTGGCAKMPCKVELFEGEGNRPKIVVHTCGDVDTAALSDDSDDDGTTSIRHRRPFRMPRTPRPDGYDVS